MVLAGGRQVGEVGEFDGSTLGAAAVHPAAVLGVRGDRPAAFADAPHVPQVIEGGAEVAGGADRAANVSVLADRPTALDQVVEDFAVGVEVDQVADVLVGELIVTVVAGGYEAADAPDRGVSPAQRWWAA